MKKKKGKAPRRSNSSWKGKEKRGVNSRLRSLLAKEGETARFFLTERREKRTKDAKGNQGGLGEKGGAMPF